MKKSKRHSQILQAIEEAGGTYPAGDKLAKQLKISEGYASRLLGSLESDGLIVRELQKDQEYLIRLTPEGQKYLLDHPYTEVGYLSFVEEEKEAVKSHFLKYLDARQAKGDNYPAGMTEHDFVFTMGRLWNCTDPLPDAYCDNLGLAPGGPYAEAARSIAAEEFWGLIDLDIDD